MGQTQRSFICLQEQILGRFCWGGKRPQSYINLSTQRKLLCIHGIIAVTIPSWTLKQQQMVEATKFLMVCNCTPFFNLHVWTIQVYKSAALVYKAGEKISLGWRSRTRHVCGWKSFAKNAPQRSETMDIFIAILVYMQLQMVNSPWFITFCTPTREVGDAHKCKVNHSSQFESSTFWLWIAPVVLLDMHPLWAALKLVIHTSSAVTGLASWLRFQLQCACVALKISSSPCPKLDSRNTDHTGWGSSHL
jgi:hypothetical protein